jgi:AraC-like DNA-binding protein
MQFENFWVDETLELSNVREFDIQYFLPPAALAPYINVFYIFRSESNLIRDVHPASAGHVMLFLKGHGEARFVDGVIQPSHKISLIGPSSSAMQYIVKGPLHCVGFTFNPAGYSCLSGQKAIKGLNKLLDATWVLGDTFDDAFGPIATLNDDDSDPLRSAKMVEKLAGFLIGKFKPLKPVPASVITKLFETLEDRLDMDLEDFYASLPLTPRQIQRICKDYLGSAPKYLIRKLRAVRAAMLLSDPECSQETRDLVLDHFYDQSHLIREISLFNGRTPKFLNGDSVPLLKMWFESAKITALSGIYSKASSLAKPNKS